MEARQAADAKVQQEVAQQLIKEAEARQNGDVKAQQDLASEAQVRLNADTDLAAKLDVFSLKGKAAIVDGGPVLTSTKTFINGAFVPQGNWLVIASVNGIGAFGEEDNDPHAWRVNCELRDGSVPGPDGLGGFIGGNFVTGFATNGLTDQHEITITAGLNVPEFTAKSVGLMCFADVETRPGTWRPAGSRIVLLEIGGFF